MWNDKEYVTARFGSEAQAAFWLTLSVEAYREWPDRLKPAQKMWVELNFAVRQSGGEPLQLSMLAGNFDDVRAAVFEQVMDKIPLAISLSKLFPQPMSVPMDLGANKPGRKRRARNDNHAFPPADAVTG